MPDTELVAAWWGLIAAGAIASSIIYLAYVLQQSFASLNERIDRLHHAITHGGTYEGTVRTEDKPPHAAQKPRDEHRVSPVRCARIAVVHQIPHGPDWLPAQVCARPLRRKPICAVNRHFAHRRSADALGAQKLARRCAQTHESSPTARLAWRCCDSALERGTAES